MNIFLTRHLYWVLWIWLLLAEANGEDGVAKSERRLVFKSESGPRGDSIQKSYLSTRTFSSSSSTVSSTDQTKPPDDRQSTTLSISKQGRNDSSVDLSRNTVPVLRSTEPGGGKYRRTTTSIPELRKSLAAAGKLKRLTGSVTRSRPADLTTLLAFNSLGPQRLQQLPYPSTTQVAEAMPPTAWALASLRGPSTSRPGPHQVRPFVSWSTRLSKPTTPSPTTELTDPVTGEGETTVAADTISDMTAEGVDNTATTPPVPESSSSSLLLNNTSLSKTLPSLLAEISAPSSESSVTSSSESSAAPSSDSTAAPIAKSSAPLTKISSQNETTLNASEVANTEKSEDISSYKAEENTISVPPLSSLKNSTLNDFIEKKDIATKVQFVSNSEVDYSHEVGLESKLRTDSILPNTEPQGFNETQEKLQTLVTEKNTLIPSTDSTPLEFPNSSTLLFNATSGSSPTNISVTVGKTIDNGALDSDKSTNSSQNDTVMSISVSPKEFATPQNATEILKPITSEDIKILEKLSTEHPQSQDDLISEVTIRRYDPPANGTIQEADPLLNVINEKKIGEGLSTSTVISAVNSSITMHVFPVLTTPGSINLTNLVEDEHKKIEAESEFVKHLPLTAETTTEIPPTPKYDLNKNVSSQPENVPAIINQTINDIKPFNDIKPIPVVLDPYTEKTSSMKPDTETRSNEIKHEILKNISSIDELKTTPHQAPELSETTQSNYIPVHETIKVQNKTVDPHFKVIEESTEKPIISAPAATSEVVPPMSMPEDITTPPLFNMSTTESTPTSLSPENTTVANDSISAIPTTVTTPLPITTTPLSTTTFMPTTMLPSSTVSPPHSTSSKSNEISEQESTKDINIPIPENNMTHFQYESPNVVKNESTPLIIQEPDDIEEEEGSFNHTDLGDKKTPSDNINNGDGEEEGDDNFPDVVGNSTLQINEKNVSKDIPLLHPTSSSPIPTTTKTSSTTPSIDEVMATQIDEDPSNIDDDTVYDTGVIMSVNIRVIFDATYNEMCREKDHLRDAIVRMFKKYAESRTIDKRQVQLVNLNRDCAGLRSEMDQRQTPVQLYITDQQGQYDKTLNDIFLSLARQYQLDFKYPITHIEKVIGQHEVTMDPDSQPSGTVVAAIIISSIAAVCLFALTILLVIMRKRQSGFNYGQRCTPVSLDDYSLDNISVYNSVRRKAMRASKRSYGNPAFDDPDVISNPVNFAGLANMASNKSKTDEEFSNLPTVVVKPDELPLGAESKNRYANVIPLPETRVQLQGSSPEEQFINANYVKGVKEREKCYIACQAPMQNTIEDFWCMIWDEQCRLIIMLTALNENGVEKCADYLPPSEVLDCHRIFGDLQVTLKKREAREKYVIASLQLKNLETNLWREVTHMWYAGWPTTGVPTEPSSIIAFLIEARSYSKGAPTVVHCSPGTGRTGTVIAIDIAIRDFEAGRSVDIPKTVIQVRRGRAGAVQTKDQYNFIYKVLHFYATKLTGGGLDSI